MKITVPVSLLITELIILSLLNLTSCREENMDVQIVKIPDTSFSNSYYISNRAPLKPSVLIKLPIGSIRPENWLKECLVRQSEGLTGHLGEISVWLQKEDNAWLSPDGEGKWGWEEVPYWLKGYANIGYILQDESMIDEAIIWLNGAINSQRSDGNFGPVSRGKRDDPQDFWPNMIMLYCLQSYYDYSGDDKVLELMTRYFRYQLNVPEEEFLNPAFYWARVRGGDNLHSVMWLYNRTGDQWLLELAEKIHRCTAPWASRGHDLDIMRNGHGGKREEMPDWYFDLIDWHNVNVAQGFREPAQYYLLSHNEKDLQASYDDFHIVREHFGQVPGGMFGADENARPGYDDPRQGIETCGMVEQMNSDEHLLRITGDILWADHCEEVAFNSLPAAIMPDFRGLRYLTCPNMVESDSKNHWPALNNGGPFLVMNPFSSRCCQHNHTQGWPYFSENLWMATPDNGLAAVIYAASTVTARVGAGKEISIHCKSNYPFEDQLEFTIDCNSVVECPLYFRIPAWCKAPSLYLNDQRVKIQPEAGKYIRIYRSWSKGDKIVLSLPKEIQVRTWTKNHNSLSVNYGPLTFSLKFDEKYVRKESDITAIHDSGWQPDADREAWPSFEIYPENPWNYGLILDPDDPTHSFSIETKAWPKDNYPFTVDAAPIILKAHAKKIPAWNIGEHDLVGELQNSPVKSDEPIENIQLIPMGAARLRISAFPVIGEKNDAIYWVK